MTGETAIEKALTILNYRDEALAGGQLMALGEAALQAVFTDLFYACAREGEPVLPSRLDEILLPGRAVNDALVFGIAAFLAQALGDGDKQNYFALLYNRKRRGLNPSGAVEDVLPTV